MKNQSANDKMKNQSANAPFDWAQYWEAKGMKRTYAHRPRAQWNNYRWRGTYLITIVTHSRKRVLGELINNPQNARVVLTNPQNTKVELTNPQNSRVELTNPQNARVELTNIGQFVEQEWLSIPAKQAAHGRLVSVLAQQVMPDHFHGVLRVEKNMDVALGSIIRDFKAQCTKAWRRMNQPILADYIESAETKARLAHMSHKQREVFYQEQGIEPLFDNDYDDTVCFRDGQTDNAIRYVLDNPRRLALKHANPQLFRMHQQVQVAGFSCTTLGNMFLLDYPMKGVIQCSRRLIQEEIDRQKEQCFEEAERGTVFVTPAISEGEKQISKALREAGYPLIVLLENGFPKETDPHYKYFKPQGVYFEACAIGQLLLIEPNANMFDSKDIERVVFEKAGVIPHETQRYRFLALNELAKRIQQ